MELLHKSINVCVKTLHQCGYYVDWWEPGVLMASFYGAGVCLRYKKLYFSPKGRCSKIEEHTCDFDGGEER